MMLVSWNAVPSVLAYSSVRGSLWPKMRAASRPTGGSSSEATGKFS